VIVNGRSATTVDAVAAALNGSGAAGRAIGVPGDLSDAEGTRLFLERIAGIGAVDILVVAIGRHCCSHGREAEPQALPPFGRVDWHLRVGGNECLMVAHAHDSSP
jgi:hypothetical protein